MILSRRVCCKDVPVSPNPLKIYCLTANLLHRPSVSVNIDSERLYQPQNHPKSGVAEGEEDESLVQMMRESTIHLADVSHILVIVAKNKDSRSGSG